MTMGLLLRRRRPLTRLVAGAATTAQRERLAALHQSGASSDAEFASAKAKWPAT